MYDAYPDIALSVRAPWAWAIIHAGKDIENRSTFAVTKGKMEPKRICIHAAKNMTQREYFEAAEFMSTIGVECPPPHILERGAIIGTVEVIDVVSKSPSPWFFGPRGLVLQNARPTCHVPVAGALGYFNWKNRRITKFTEPAKWMLPEPAKQTQQETLI